MAVWLSGRKINKFTCIAVTKDNHAWKIFNRKFFYVPVSIATIKLYLRRTLRRFVNSSTNAIDFEVSDMPNAFLWNDEDAMKRESRHPKKCIIKKFETLLGDNDILLA